MRSFGLPLGRLDRRILIRVVGIGAAAFLIGYLFTALLFFGGSDRPDVASVPDLRGLAQEAAEERLEDQGLQLEIGDSLPHPQVRAGAILAQSPLPGREVAPGTPVRVIMSSGRPQRAVPDVTALTREPASQMLSASGFQVSVVEVPAAEPAGRVVSIFPAPGTRVQLPAVVQLRVSAGPPRVAVPELAGLGEEEARAALESVGLRLGEVHYEFGGFNAQEMVVEQVPAAGDSILLGRPVEVRIVTNRLTGTGEPPRGDADREAAPAIGAPRRPSLNP